MINGKQTSAERENEHWRQTLEALARDARMVAVYGQASTVIRSYKRFQSETLANFAASA